MSEGTDRLIDRLAADARPVRVLAPPLRRALLLLAFMGAVALVAILTMGDMDMLRARYSGREWMMFAETAAMLATGALAVTGAFFLSIPGRSRRWLAAPLPAAVLWIALSGMGCWRDLVRHGSDGWSLGHSSDCLLFILGVSAAFGIPLFWRLSRSAPIDPLRVALLAGLGTAAMAAFLLQFFHPLAVTFMDLGVHIAAILIVIGAASLLRGRMLARAEA
ncbi:MAG TPA: NrsF family protein [Allosphingosinicella sp.]|nr:NrsF family protein [Allosphingosinicella sp.]